VVRDAGPSRRRAREAAFRTVYQADVTGDSYAAAWEARRHEEQLGEPQKELVVDVVAALEARGPEVDGWIREAAEHWPLERMSATDRAVLRAAVAELVARPGTPARVVLDEAIEISRRFGSEESSRFVNGILDRIAHAVRSGEF
jgi:N utilization substance protein B